MKGFLWVTSVLAVVFLAFILFQSSVNGPKAAEVEKNLQLEFNSIKVLSNSTEVNRYVNHKDSQAIVSYSYLTNIAYEDIYKHYDMEFVNNGWSKLKEETVKYKGTDYGGKSIIYRKGEYEVALEYSGKNPQLNYTFAISVSWN